MERPSVSEGMLSTSFFTQGEKVSDDQHVAIFYESPSVANSDLASEYLRVTRGVNVNSGVIRRAVRNGELTAYRIGVGYHYKPTDLDAWLESRKVGA